MEASLRSEGGGGPVAHPRAGGRALASGQGAQEGAWAAGSEGACRAPAAAAL